MYEVLAPEGASRNERSASSRTAQEVSPEVIMWLVDKLPSASTVLELDQWNICLNYRLWGVVLTERASTNPVYHRQEEA